MLATLFFVFILSLLLLHEMDAIRTKEWRMFIILKDLPEETAYRVFSILHLPLYFAALVALVWGGLNGNFILFIILDLFLVAHAFIHFGFRNHASNGFTSLYSKVLIYVMGALSVAHLCLLAFGV